MHRHGTRTTECQRALANAIERIINRYTNQPTRLPAELRAQVERAFDGRPVQLYALCDLDASLSLGETWLCLGPERVAIARRAGDPAAGGWTLELHERARVREARETPGLSCNVLHLQGPPGEPPLAVVRYTHRQRRAVEAIRAALESPPARGRRHRRRRPLRRRGGGPIREAQALVAGSDTAIILRLLGYLRPYRKQVAIGLGAAALVTALSLVPPYLAGYLIDKVARPVQEGRLAREAASRIALLCVGAIAAAYVLRSLLSWVRLRFMAFLGEYVARDLRTENLRAPAGAEPELLLPQEDGQPHHARHVRHRPPVGLPRLRGGRRVAVGGHAGGHRRRAHQPRLAAGPGDDPAGARALRLHLLERRHLERYFLRGWRRWSALTDVVSDTIPGIRVVKAFNQEKSERRRFGDRNHAATSEFNEIHEVWTRFWPILTFGIHALAVAVWFLALPRLLGNAAPQLSLGSFVSFLLYSGMFAGPIEVIGQMTRVLNRATSSAQRIFEVLDTEPEVVDPVAPVRIEPLDGRVAFDGVSFGYEATRLVLRQVTSRCSRAR